MCDECRQRLQPLPPPRCVGCGGTVDGVLDVCSDCLVAEPRPWHAAATVFALAGYCRELVLRFKYSGATWLAPAFGEWMAERWRQSDAGCPDVVAAVPLHWRRLLTRGYNQSALLGQEVARHLGVPYRELLTRPRSTGHQARLTREQRQRNLARGFATPRSARVEGRYVLLVDDVMTTGNTLGATTRVLLRAGAARVGILTIARG